MEDPAIDLAVVVAVISSLNEIPVPDKVCFAGEVGLGGEIRAVNRAAHRVSEAGKLGFEAIYLSKYTDLTSTDAINMLTFGRIQDLFSDLWG